MVSRAHLSLYWPRLEELQPANEFHTKRFLLGLLLVYWAFLPTKAKSDQIQPIVSIPQQSETLQMPSSKVLAVESYLSDYHYGSQTDDYNLATAFVEAADESNIDYRILPSIFVIESTAGKHGLYNNYFGFMQNGAGGLRHFSSTESSVYFISDALTKHPYAGKSLRGIVQTYNSANPAYFSEFMVLYNKITVSEESYQTLMPMVANNQLEAQN